MVKNLPASAEATGDIDSIPGGHGNPHQYSSLKKQETGGYSPCGRRVGHNCTTEHTRTDHLS